MKKILNVTKYNNIISIKKHISSEKQPHTHSHHTHTHNHVAYTQARNRPYIPYSPADFGYSKECAGAAQGEEGESETGQDASGKDEQRTQEAHRAYY